jgi:hypothetical protein
MLACVTSNDLFFPSGNGAFEHWLDVLPTFEVWEADDEGWRESLLPLSYWVDREWRPGVSGLAVPELVSPGKAPWRVPGEYVLAADEPYEYLVGPSDILYIGYCGYRGLGSRIRDYVKAA